MILDKPDGADDMRIWFRNTCTTMPYATSPKRNTDIIISMLTRLYTFRILYHFKPFVFTIRFHGREHKGNGGCDGKPVNKRVPSCAVLLLGGRRRWIGILFLLRLVRVGRDRCSSIEDVNKTSPHKLLFPFLVSPILRHIISLKNV